MTDPPPDREKQLLELLVQATASGAVDPEVALPAVTKLLVEDSGEAPVRGTADDLVRLLAEREGDEFVALRRWLGERRLSEALRFYEADQGGERAEGDALRFRFFLGDLPRQVKPRWRLAAPTEVQAVEAVAFLRSEGLIHTLPDFSENLQAKLIAASVAMRDQGHDVDVISSRLLEELEGCSAELRHTLTDQVHRFEETQKELIHGNLLVGVFPERVNSDLLLEALRARLAGGGLSWSERRSLVVACCQWKSPVLEPIVAKLVESDARLGEVAALILRMRFGKKVAAADSPGKWFADQNELFQLAAGSNVSGVALLGLWSAAGESLGAGGAEELDARIAEASGLDRAGVARRWKAQISDREWEILSGEARSATAETVPEAVIEKEVKPVGRLPALWAEHVQPFVVENWYMVAGIFMTIVGASLLAFYTWDRHWLIRYTLMPGMLALFTAGLARAGTWIAGKGSDFLGTAAMLRGAAIGLLPVNFMAVALLAKDDAVSQKLLAVGLMGLIYVVLAGWGLWRWCRAEHRSLGVPMGGTLLVLNSLVALGPLAMGLNGGQVHEVVVGVGFYLGFLLLAASVVWFGMRQLDAGMLRERRVPWFFFVGLAGTFVQVFLWVHGQAGSWPDVHTYAPLLVLGGGLALFFDRRSAFLLGETDRQDKLGAVTSLGFGAVMLGVVMAMADEQFRVLTLFLAGLVWIGQALWRGRMAVAQFWIGLTFLALSVASIGLLDGFPRFWLPVLATVGALICLATEPSARALRREFGEAMRGMHYAALVIAVVVALLTQWHLQSVPGYTAAWLIAVAALFGHGARRERSVRWVHVAMVVLGMSIPYLGFVDMGTHDWRGNTVVFGLAILSFLWIWLSSTAAKFPTAARGRSTVLWFYGLLAVVAMVIRIYWEGARPAGIGGFAKFMDLGGPLLMAAALMAASYFSRSLVAGGMAAVILVILFPELKATFEDVLPANLWGSGIGSSTTALGLIALSFWLRRAVFLKDMAPGDRFMDRYDFPLRRFDHSLATWPVVASACFLTAKIVVLNVPWYLNGQTLDVLFGLALVACALVCGMLAVYFRKSQPLPAIIVQVGLLLLLISNFALFDRLAWNLELAWRWGTFLMVAIAIYLGCRVALRRWQWMERTLVRPIFWGVAFWSVIAGWVAIWEMVSRGDLSPPMGGLVILLIGLLVWLELGVKKWVHGVVLFILAWTAVIAKFGGSVDHALWVPAAILIGGTAVEFFASMEKKLRPLIRVEVWLATLCVILIGVIEISGFDGSVGILVVVAMGLAARAHRSTPLAVLAIWLGFLAAIGGLGIELDLVTKSGGLALLLAASIPIGWWLLERHPVYLKGARPQRPFQVSTCWVLVVASVLAAVYSIVGYESAKWGIASIDFRLPVLALAALVVLAVALESVEFGWLALLVSVQVGARFADDRLGAVEGLDPWLMVAIGMSMSLLGLMAIDDLRRTRRVRRFTNDGGSGLGLGILAALVVNFELSRAMEDATWLPLLVSAVMAYIAARGLRRGGRPFVAAYHAALVLMGWCAVFAIPSMRHFELVLAGGFLPALYFWWRAERGGADRYRLTALVLAAMAVGGWLIRDLLGPVLLGVPEIPDSWFHFGAPVVLLAGVMAKRLRSDEGVMAMIVGSFFCVTAIPVLSPFAHPMAAAWVAIGLGHLWVVLVSMRQWFAARGVVPFLVVAAHVAIISALLQRQPDSGSALLLLGGATLLFHLAFRLEKYWLHRLACAAVLLALHVEVAWEDVLGAHQVIWVLLGLWLINLLFYDAVIRRCAAGGRNFLPLVLGGLVMGHVIWIHGADTWQGLLAVVLGGGLAALTRASERVKPWCLLLLAVPVWLTFFALDGGILPPLAAAAVALAIAWWLHGAGRPVAGDRLLHWAIGDLDANGARLAATVNYAALAIAAALHWWQTSRGDAFGSLELLLLLGIYLAIAISFALRRHFLPPLVASLFVQACAFLMFHALRAQLVMTTDLWQPVYDIWATILASFVLVGIREMRPMGGEQARASLAISLCLMPLAGLGIVAQRGLDADAALLVVGIQSMVFSYLGRGRRESPYNFVAISGFVAFVMMVFWSKLEFRVAHAYVVPAGLGVLALVQLFHRIIPPATRNAVRLFTLVAMLGTTAYTALLDDRYPVVFHLTMLVLCLGCMGLGSLLRVRLYLYLGFAGLVVNLASILHKVLGAMERGSRMTVIGSLVLLGGIAVLATAIYYKTHRGAMDALIQRLRSRLAAWE
ncbi:MAG: hypothetical protein ACI9MB_000006 [Verrucomicrobiales bacterium]